jgi:O-antigen biosynthesis protein
MGGPSGFEPLVVVLPDDEEHIDRVWLNQLRTRLPGRYLTTSAAAVDDLQTLEANPRHWPALIEAVAGNAGDHGALVIESGLELPEDFAARLARLAASPDLPPLTLFAGNHDDAANPAAGIEAELTAQWCDDLAHLAGRLQWTEVDHDSRRLTFVAATKPAEARVAAQKQLGWIYDGIYIHDPSRRLTEGNDRHPALTAALGPVRLAMTRMVTGGETDTRLPAIGRDERPVTLHVSHHWGGGVARWIDDIMTADTHGHHLVLAARGHTDGKTHGQYLSLYATGPTRGLIEEWVLAPAIAATGTDHRQYRDILAQVIKRYGIGRIIISSLIGHSLDALQTDLPTVQVLHDYYPAWPALDFDPLDFLEGDRPNLERAIARSGEGFLFEPVEAAHWHEMAKSWQQLVNREGIPLVAPTEQVRQRWEYLTGGGLDPIEIVPHGFTGWPDPPRFEPKTRPDGKLNLVIVGRLSPGKGLGLLEAALPKLREVAHLTLVGCGHHGMRLFGQAGVDILLDFEHKDLPRLMATLRPQAALFLSTVAETWNYVLSETRSLGLVPIATRTGSFIERIDDGHDGVVFDPEPEQLVTCLTALQQQPEQLTGMGARLPTETSVTEAIAALDRMAPCRPVSMSTPGRTRNDAVQTLMRDARLAAIEQQRAQLTERNELLYADLVKRTAWAQKHERLTHERTDQLGKALKRIEDQSNEIKERTRWAQSLEQALDVSRARIDQLQHDLGAVHASTSWRITRPLRFVTRLGSNARANRIWNPLTWPRLLGQFGHDVRTRGLGGAIDRMQHIAPPEEAPSPAPTTVPTEPVAQPAADPEPVRIEPADRVRVSIIIPVYNKYEYTAACLHSIAEHTRAGEFEIIVVDDCSSDHTAGWLERCSGLRVIRNETNAGFIRSCNAGAQAATGEFLVFLNNDTTVTTGWLESLIGTFERIPDAGVVGARLVYPDGRLQEAGGIIFNDASGWNYGRDDDPDRPQYNFVNEADYVSGACLAIRRDDFQQLGGFDTRFAPAYYEDTDLCFQVRAMSKRVIYQPAATIVHHEGISSGTEETSGTKRYQAINRDKFREKWAAVLADHPAPEPDEARDDPVRHLRFRHRPKRLLLIDAVTPQPDHDSGSVRIMAMMTLLEEMGYQVTFMPENLAWVDGYSNALQQAGVEVLCAPRIESLDQWLSEHGRDLDLVIVSRYYVLAPLLPLIRRHCRQAQLIFDTVDLHFLREEREAEVTGSSEAAVRAAESRRQELSLIRKADITLVVSAAERELLGELTPDANVQVVSNIHTVHGRQHDWRDRRDLMFVGGFQHLPNVDAAQWLVEEIFPRVRARIPDIRLHLIGSRMPPEILSIEKPGVEVHGFVPELDPYLENCRLSVAPLRYGAGVKGKVNQAMSHGLPVVATSCAAEGMFLEHGNDVLIADDAEAFARCIVEAYEDETLWHRLSDGGIDNVHRHFSLEAARKALVSALKLQS